MGAARVLVVDDEVNLAEGIRENLVAEGYEVAVVMHGGDALDRLRSETFDLVVLDVMLPGLDGWTICEVLRRERNMVPILFLTARTAAEDRMHGLEVGGDDYLAKPFHLKELLLRIAAILRRSRWYQAPERGASQAVFGGHVVNFSSYVARTTDGRDHLLSHKEAMILRLLVERSGAVVQRDEILERVWGTDVYPSTRTVDNFIVRLRKRFESEPATPRFFHTVRGIGYRFTPEGD